LAFAPVEELAPTRVQRRPEPPPGRMALDAPVKVGPVRAVSVMHGPARPVVEPARAAEASPPNATDKVPSLTATSPRTLAILERVAYVACGALVALVIAYFGLRPSKSTPAAMAAAAAQQPVSTPLSPARNVEPPALVNEPEPTTFDA